MAKRKRARENQSHDYWIVEKVTKCKYNRKKERIEYGVIWEKLPGQRRPEKTDEPLHFLQKCPLLIFDYELKHFNAWKKKCEESEPLTRKEPLMGRFRNFEVDHKLWEYVPTGKEHVRKIYATWTHDKPATEFFYVRFYGSGKERHFVRRVYMDYYFPVDVLLFWSKVGKEMEDEDSQKIA